MGAATFAVRIKGKTAKEAFAEARANALYEYGHRGYTGTIAEKYEFVMIPLPTGIDAADYVDMLLQKDDPRIEDKWGPAGCIAVGEDEYIFFGNASS